MSIGVQLINIRTFYKKLSQKAPKIAVLYAKGKSFLLIQ
jgi:hypothetical protein